MKKKTSQHSIHVGFDFDKVLVSYPPIIPDGLVDWLYKKKSKTLKYRFPRSIEQKIRVVSHFPIFRHPIWQNIEIVEKLAQQNGHKLFLVSSRFGFLEKKTRNWLKKFPVDKHFQEVHFNFKNKQPHLFKNEMIKTLKINYFVDDDLDLLLYLAKENPDVTFYWLNSNKLSKRFIPFENIHKINTLSELPKL